MFCVIGYGSDKIAVGTVTKVVCAHMFVGVYALSANLSFSHSLFLSLCPHPYPSPSFLLCLSDFMSVASAFLFFVFFLALSQTTFTPQGKKVDKENTDLANTKEKTQCLCHCVNYLDCMSLCVCVSVCVCVSLSLSVSLCL